MKALVIGKGEGVVNIVTQMTAAGHSVAHVSYRGFAKEILERSTYDLVLLTECDRLEETDLIAEKLKGFCITPPCVIVLWDAICGFEKASDYGLEDIDILLETFSVDLCEQALQSVKNNEK